MRTVLAIDEESYGTEHPDVARDLSNLAVLLKDTKCVAAAEPLMRRLLAIDEKSYGTQHPDVAIDLSNLAVLLKATNRSAQEEPLYRRRWRSTRSLTERNTPKLLFASTTWLSCSKTRTVWRKPSRSSRCA